MPPAPFSRGPVTGRPFSSGKPPGCEPSLSPGAELRKPTPGPVGAHLATWEPTEIRKHGGEMEMKRLSPQDMREPTHEAIPETPRCFSGDVGRQLLIFDVAPGS